MPGWGELQRVGAGRSCTMPSRYIVTAQLEFAVPTSTRFLLNLRVRDAPRQDIEHEQLVIQLADASTPEVVELTGEGGSRLLLFAATSDLRLSYQATVVCAPVLRPAVELADRSAATLDAERASYLFPSRYCESDQLGRLAWQQFGHHRGPFAQAAAITGWIHAHTAYVPGSSHSGTSATAILVQRAGVCRDFAHLGIALCRALNLPARYATGYAYGLQPPDMHAWFEVAIGDDWVAFDPTRLAPPTGLVRVAHGRDAADTSIVTTFGPALARRMQFDCQPADPDQTPPDPPRADAEPDRLLVHPAPSIPAP